MVFRREPDARSADTTTLGRRRQIGVDVRSANSHMVSDFEQQIVYDIIKIGLGVV